MIGLLLGYLARTRSNAYKLKKNNYALITPESHLGPEAMMALVVGRTLLKCDGNFNHLPKEVLKTAEAMLDEDYPEMKELYGSDEGFSCQSISYVALCGMVGKTVDEVQECAHQVVQLTHENEEDRRAAEALAMCVHSSRKRKETQLHNMSKHYMPMNFNLEMIRKRKRDKITQLESVAYALEAHLEGTSFTDSLHFAMGLNHISKDIFPYTAAIASRGQGVPEELKEMLLDYLDDNWLDIVMQFDARYPTQTWRKRYRKDVRVYGVLPWFRDAYFIGKKYLESMREAIPIIERLKRLVDKHRLPAHMTTDSDVRGALSADEFSLYERVLRKAAGVMYFFADEIASVSTKKRYREDFNQYELSDRIAIMNELIAAKAFYALDLYDVELCIAFKLRYMRWSGGFVTDLHHTISNDYLKHLYQYLMQHYTDDVLYDAVQKNTDRHSAWQYRITLHSNDYES